MRFVVDLTGGRGCAQYAHAAPDVFWMRGGEALPYDPEPGDTQRERVLLAAAACTVRAPGLLVDPPPCRPDPLLHGPRRPRSPSTPSCRHRPRGAGTTDPSNAVPLPVWRLAIDLQ